MRKCIISSNCQGVPLASQLLSFSNFADEFELDIYLNYTKTNIPDDKLKKCDLLIYQKLDNSWGRLSEKYLLEHVNAKTICMPNVMNFSFWPTARNSVGGVTDLWGDSFLDELIRKKLDAKDIVYLAMKANLAKLFDLEKISIETIQKEREKKYFKCDEICDFVESNFKIKQLFTTPNHPYGELLVFIAKLLLKEIGYSNFSDCFLPNLDCDPEFHLPIHPFMLEYYDISFIDYYHKYPVFGRKLTYEEYLCDYILAKQQAIPVGIFMKDYGELKNNC